MTTKYVTYRKSDGMISGTMVVPHVDAMLVNLEVGEAGLEIGLHDQVKCSTHYIDVSVDPVVLVEKEPDVSAPPPA